MFITYHKVLLEILYTNTHTHTHTDTHENTIKFFLWNFEIIHGTQAFFLYFHRLTKPTTFVPVVINKPLFTQNVFESKLLLCIVFIADFFRLLHG